MQVHVRFPNLRGRTIQSAAKQNEDKLIKTMNKLIVSETKKKVVRPAPKKPIEGGRIRDKKPKTFAL